jgi:hypothetical protein
MPLELWLRGAVLLAGILLVLVALDAAIRAFVLPRNESVLISNWVFRSIRSVFSVAAAAAGTYGHRDKVLALYAPLALVSLPIVWLAMLSAAYTGIFWALGEGPLGLCYQLSNNSLLTLGSMKPKGMVASVFSYSEATLGLLLLTLLISYLPTIYQAFSRREVVVAQIELRAGKPSSAPTLIAWLNRSGSLRDDEQWFRWEQWFVEIEESHTSLPILSFFRSPQPGRSWVTAAGIVLDTAALITSTMDQPRSPQMELCFKAGCITMNRIYRFFQERAHSRPSHLLAETESLEEPTRREFMRAYAELQAHGVPVVPDQEAAWQQFHQLRGRYDAALTFLAKLTMAPEVKPIT